MLTHPIARQIWSRLCSQSPEWLQQHGPLLVKSAWLIRAKCGRAEARQFIALVRLALV